MEIRVCEKRMDVEWEKIIHHPYVLVASSYLKWSIVERTFASDLASRATPAIPAMTE